MGGLLDSYKGVGRTSTSPESTLHKIIIIIIIMENSYQSADSFVGKTMVLYFPPMKEM